MSDIDEAKKRLPLAALMGELGLAKHAKKSARCPFHDDQHNSFSVYQKNGTWRWKCHAGCGQGDEITFLECYKSISKREAIKLFLEMSGVNGGTPPHSSAHKRSNKAAQTTLDWLACVDAFTDKNVEWFAKSRGYSVELCSWLKEKGLIGLYLGHVAFPVYDATGAIVGAHYQP